MHWHLKTRKSWWLPRLRPGAELPHSLRLQSWAQGSRPKVVRRIYISIILARIRDACGNQNRWTFKKVPNGLPPPSFSENYIADSLKWLQSLRKLPEHHTCGIFSENPGYENIKNYDPGCQIQKCPKSNTSQLQILALVGSGPFHQCTFSLKREACPQPQMIFRNISRRGGGRYARPVTYLRQFFLTIPRFGWGGGCNTFGPTKVHPFAKKI